MSCAGAARQEGTQAARKNGRPSPNAGRGGLGAAFYVELLALCYALIWLPTVFLLYNYTALYQCGVLFLAALAGNALGALWRRPRKEERQT